MCTALMLSSKAFKAVGLRQQHDQETCSCRAQPPDDFAGVYRSLITMRPRIYRGLPPAWFFSSILVRHGLSGPTYLRLDELNFAQVAAAWLSATCRWLEAYLLALSSSMAACASQDSNTNVHVMNPWLSCRNCPCISQTSGAPPLLQQRP